jgi:hypothetical protein
MSQNFYNAYRPLKGLSLPAIIGLALICFLNFLTVAFSLLQIVQPFSMINLGGRNYYTWLLLVSLSETVKLLIYLFTLVFFLIWLNRANKNLDALGVENKEFSSGWAVGWWFVPFANLLKPFQVVREIWNESDPDFEPGLNFLSSGNGGAPTLLTAWWAFWIVSNIAANIASRVVRDDASQALGAAPYLLILTAIFSLVAGMLAIKVVLGITQRQELRYQKLGNTQQFMPPAPPKFD